MSAGITSCSVKHLKFIDKLRSSSNKQIINFQLVCWESLLFFKFLIGLGMRCRFFELNSNFLWGRGVFCTIGVLDNFAVLVDIK